jgi:hypothetical protein
MFSVTPLETTTFARATPGANAATVKIAAATHAVSLALDIPNPPDPVQRMLEPNTASHKSHRFRGKTGSS